MSDRTHSEGYRQALELIHLCATPHGYVASTTDVANYKRIWARDGVIIGMASLLTNNRECTHTFFRTLVTLRDHQGPHGEIPSNVDPESGRVSLGGTAGRVDADLWFLIGCGAYWRATHDEQFLHDFLPTIQRVQFLLGCWEFNNRGLLYVPQTGDWSDEYIQQGYVLYDQLLYWRALTDAADMLQNAQNKEDYLLKEKIERLGALIRSNYWFHDSMETTPSVYHPILYEKGCQAAKHRNRHWMPFFSPTGYGYRFDALANVLASLLGIADDVQRAAVDSFIATEVVDDTFMLLPAFHPVIQPETDAWQSLQVSFSYTFKNQPYEFQNGGLWPFVTGFYVADLAKRGKHDLAKKYLEGIHTANALSNEEAPWGFYEYIHGAKHTPGGTQHQGWSAAAAIIGHHALEGSFFFSTS